MMDFSYSDVALQHLKSIQKLNELCLQKIVRRLVRDVSRGRSLFVAGSGHSSLFPLELFHRAGGASFVIPVVADYLMPQATPGVVRVLERRPETALPILERARPRKGEMIWIMSQSGINGTSVEWALESKRRGLHVVAWTSRVHSQGVESRHPSGKKLFEVADEVVDLGGRQGDAMVPVATKAKGEKGVLHAGPVSLLGAIFLGHTIVVEAASQLEKLGVPCIYTSVNTPEGEKKNLTLESRAGLRDDRLADAKK